LHFSGKGDTVVFITSALAIIPLAALLSFATEELAVRVGDAVSQTPSSVNLFELILAL